MRKILGTLVIMIALFSTAEAATLVLTGTIRDFNESHADMEQMLYRDYTGIVDSKLGVDGKPVYAGGTGTYTTNGKDSFDEWYNDTAGVNESKSHSITLKNTIATPDIYTYTSDEFFPIDNQLLGNLGDPNKPDHNFHFTYEIHSDFEYQGGETFKFRGDDDLWLFLDGKLVIDLGGVHGPLDAEVSLDDLLVEHGFELTLGQTYDFDLFFAERNTAESHFRIDTSIKLNEVPEPASIILLLTGFLGFMTRIVRKK